MRHLVVGSRGQVGSALMEVLSSGQHIHALSPDGIDINDAFTIPPSRYPMVHICIPYNDKFIETTKAYLEQYLMVGGIAIIHSTVAVGTSSKNLSL